MGSQRLVYDGGKVALLPKGADAITTLVEGQRSRWCLVGCAVYYWHSSSAKVAITCNLNKNHVSAFTLYSIGEMQIVPSKWKSDICCVYLCIIGDMHERLYWMVVALSFSEISHFLTPISEIVALFSISIDSFHNRKYHLSVANFLNWNFIFSDCFPVTPMTGGDCEIFHIYFFAVIRVDSRQSQADNAIKGSYFRKRYFPILAPYICNYDVITIFVNLKPRDPWPIRVSSSPDVEL